MVQAGISINILYPRYESENVGVFLTRSSSCKSEIVAINVNCEIGLMYMLDNKLLHSKKSINCSFSRSSSLEFRSFVTRSKLFQEKNLYLPNDVLTLRCRIWKIAKTSFVTDRQYLSTCFQVNHHCFTWKIEQFSMNNYEHIIMGGSQKTFQLYLLNNRDSLTATLSYSTVPAESLKLELFGKIKTKYSFKLIIRLMDSSYFLSTDDFSHETIPYQNSYRLLISREEILNNRVKYLNEDVLSLNCLFVVTSYVLQSTSSNSSTAFFPCIIGNKKRKIYESDDENVTHSLRKDILKLYQKKDLCDFNFQVESQLIPVHSVVLGSRSPVFLKLFQHDMKEKTNKIIDIQDLDINTVTKMLDYIYSGDIGELNVDGCLKLYYAADKYNITGLMEQICDFLKNSLSVDNVLDVLEIADRHTDEKLGNAALKFILKHEREFLFSKKFRNLSTSNCSLAFQILERLNKLRFC